MKNNHVMHGSVLCMRPSPESVLTQLRKGTLGYCVLVHLQGSASYGLDIAKRLGHDNVLFASEGTLYPLLARLRKQGWVQTDWRESTTGPPRRYYSLTEDGRAALEVFNATWVRFRDGVDATLEGALND